MIHYRDHGSMVIIQNLPLYTTIIGSKIVGGPVYGSYLMVFGSNEYATSLCVFICMSFS